MRDILEFIGDHIDEKLGVTMSAYGQLPSEGNVILYNFKAGIKPSYALGRSNSYRRRPFLQVIVRNESYDKALDIANVVTKELERLHGEKGILSITATTDILEYGRDKDNNYNFLMNFILDIEEE